jgi:hypothetical protein
MLAVYVSPNGSDAAPGTLGAPLRSLSAAAQAAALAQRGGTVWLRGNAGAFRSNATLVLTGEHNSTSFRCYDETCTVSGSAALPPLSAWSTSHDARVPSAAAGHVLELDLGLVLPVAISQLGTVTNKGDHATLRLGDTPLHLARWPNLDPANELVPAWTRNVDQPRPPAACAGGASFPTGHEACVVVDGAVAARSQRWRGAAARGELALSGFWRYMWRDDVAHDVTVAPLNGTAVLLTRRDGDPMGIYGAPPNASHFFALNVLEELDAPGEYIAREPNPQCPGLAHPAC